MTQDRNWYAPSVKMPKEVESNIVYSLPVLFKTNNGHEYEGWFRFDFDEWIVAGKTISFCKSEILKWKYI